MDTVGSGHNKGSLEMVRDVPILPAKFLENYVGKSKEQNAGKIGTKEWQLGTFCMIKIEIL